MYDLFYNLTVKPAFQAPTNAEWIVNLHIFSDPQRRIDFGEPTDGIRFDVPEPRWSNRTFDFSTYFIYDIYASYVCSATVRFAVARYREIFPDHVTNWESMRVEIRDADFGGSLWYLSRENGRFIDVTWPSRSCRHQVFFTHACDLYHTNWPLLIELLNLMVWQIQNFGKGDVLGNQYITPRRNLLCIPEVIIPWFSLTYFFGWHWTKGEQTT